MRSRCRLVHALVAALVGACGGGEPSGTVASTTTASSPATTAMAPTSPPEGARLRVDLRGLGPVRVGMTLEAAAGALGRPLGPVTPPTEECTFYAPASGLDGVSFLVAGGTVARVDVTSGPTATVEGLAIGQSEAEAQQHYGHRLQVSAHDYQLGGHYLTLVPTDRADAGFRLVAETDGVKVTGIRAGRLPEVDLTEGCA